MFDGYARAVGRFRAAAKGRDEVEAFIPLFECLNWAVAVDDRTRVHWAPDGKPIGWAWRERVAGAEIMQGVRFARNSVHHQWSDALELDDSGFQLPTTLPIGFFEWVWRKATQLPDLDRPDPRGEAIYLRDLEAKPARLTLDTLGSAFAFLQGLLEPHTLRRN